ncbi:TPA: LemA family protein [candidate division WOR-3 bacterium]|jgi:LemA protein|uniref:LemA family protein n=1 Tax=candidate division WOR-3 bacterium TaxID=2052148 RepID=A0A350HBE0_UNCW3|nr:LemA family protein [candidate division WOR-3 bacterium]
MIVFFIGLIFITVIFGFFFIFYNTLIFLKNRVFQALSNINVLLKQRNDEIPNLVEIVKHYAKFEKELLENVTKIRSGYSENLDVEGKATYSSSVSNQLKSIFALAEKYPDLKADKQFLRLQERITSLENQIADRRESYNWCVTNFNTRCEQFPFVIIAGMFNMNRYPLFQNKK